jgi:cytochrome c oxidase subunit 2
MVAQTREQLHSQNPDHASDQVHSKGTAVPENMGFIDTYRHPEDITTFGHIFDSTFQKISWETSFFAAVILLVLVISAVFFRYKKDRRASYFDGGSKAFMAGIIGVGVLFFLVLDLPLIVSSYKDTHNVIWNYPTGPNVVKIMVQPQQWVWNFKYAGNDGEFNTDDDIDTINELKVPKGKQVMLQLKSKDVIHGFMIPNLRYQIDVLPGTVTKFWFDTTKTGQFELACYHLCGTSHYKMKAFFHVMEPSDYDLWLAENSEWAKAKYDPEDKQIRWGWSWNAAEAATSPTAKN